MNGLPTSGAVRVAATVISQHNAGVEATQNTATLPDRAGGENGPISGTFPKKPKVADEERR
jgi:hypothetical protein